MTMVDFWEAVIAGVVSGLLVSFFLWVLTCLTEHKKAKYSRQLHLQNLLSLIYQIENKCRFPEDYSTIVDCTKDFHKEIWNFYSNLDWLFSIFDPKKKKIICTALYDLIRRTDYVFYGTVGYRNEQEYSARLEVFRRRIFEGERSILQSHMELIMLFEQGERSRQVFAKLKKLYKDIELNEMFDINSYRSSITSNNIQQEGISKEEFEKLIRKTRY